MSDALLMQRRVAHFLFDEAHNESWTIDPAQAARINPNYARSPNAFQPQQHRRDGLENLVFFPM